MSGPGEGPVRHGEGDPPPPAGSFGLHEDVIAAIAIIVFGAVVVGLTTTFEEVAPALAQGVPPESFPRLMVAVLAVLAVIMAVQSRGKPAKRRKRLPGMLYFSLGAVLAFALLIEVVGAIGAMVLFCLGLPILWGERRLGWVVVYAIVFPASVYLLFTRLLEVRFPAGILFPSLFG